MDNRELSDTGKEEYGFQTGNPLEAPIVHAYISSFTDTHGVASEDVGELQRKAMSPIFNHPVAQHVFSQSDRDAKIKKWLSEEK